MNHQTKFQMGEVVMTKNGKEAGMIDMVSVTQTKDKMMVEYGFGDDFWPEEQLVRCLPEKEEIKKSEDIKTTTVPAEDFPELQCLLDGANHAEELAYSLRELHELTASDDRNQLNCGMHMISVYERLIKTIEQSMDPSYRKNIDEFRKTF